jgi:hypothetical protein
MTRHLIDPPFLLAVVEQTDGLRKIKCDNTPLIVWRDLFDRAALRPKRRD